MPESIPLHQTLHGYSDGHQLLASSVELTRDQQSQLLMMSDLSGPSFQPGFESYLTGYPLDGGGLYCIGRTWYAMELPRPGCVWTHTIVIRDTDVARVPDFRGVLPLFRRPSSKQDVDAYYQSLSYRNHSSGPYVIESTLANAILQALYDSPLAVFLIADGSEPYESLALAILSQQWPRLRRNFRFCTGTLSVREPLFDFSVGPVDAARFASDRSKIALVSASPRVRLRQRAWDAWISVALKDLVSAERHSGLRQFLWRFGPDFGAGRSVFRALCEVYLADGPHASSESVDQLLSAVGRFFPAKDSASRLKLEFFGSSGRYGRLPHGESEVLRALMTHPAGKSIADEVANIEARGRSLVLSELEKATEVALAVIPLAGWRSSEFLAGYASGIEFRSEALRFIPLSLLVDLVSRNTRLLTLAESWQRSPEDQEALCSQIRDRETIPEVLVPAVVIAILNAGAWAAFRLACKCFGREALAPVLTWIEQLDGETLAVPSAVRLYLSEHKSEIVELIGSGVVGRCGLKVASAILDPRSARLRRMGPKPWVVTARSPLRLSECSDDVRSEVFLLGLGLSLREADSAALVAAGFSPVYEAARASAVDDGTWGILEAQLPWYPFTWDRCARLTLAVVQAFLERSWPTSEFLAAFRTEEQFSKALEEADYSWEGRRYISRICKMVASGDIVPQPHHLSPLGRFC